MSLTLAAGEAVGDVMRRGLALDRGVEREDHLAHVASRTRATSAPMRESSGPTPSSADSVPPST